MLCHDLFGEHGRSRAKNLYLRLLFGGSYEVWCKDEEVAQAPTKEAEAFASSLSDFANACRTAAAELLAQRAEADKADFLAKVRELYPERRDASSTGLAWILGEAEDAAVQSAIRFLQDRLQ
mmetsp:Transcript_148852/g.478153  ORF Transcript_148852/g.478153 Transcript_148852/m.478153 type:complete len:122 (+) Transcript_148852:944-1309(+)